MGCQQHFLGCVAVLLWRVGYEHLLSHLHCLYLSLSSKVVPPCLAPWSWLSSKGKHGMPSVPASACLASSSCKGFQQADAMLQAAAHRGRPRYLKLSTSIDCCDACSNSYSPNLYHSSNMCRSPYNQIDSRAEGRSQLPAIGMKCSSAIA